MAIVTFLLIISVLVFIHEAGHFFSARRLGVAVEEFGFGFPPRLWSIKRGPTIFSINLIPFGGFVRLQGEHEDEAVRPDSFITARPLKRFAIVAAGVVMNYLLAWVLLSSVLASGVTINEDQVPMDQWHRFTSVTQTLAVGVGSPAAMAGIQAGDQAVSMNGQVVHNTTELINLIKKNNYPVLTVVYKHAGQTKTATITPLPASQSQQPRYGLGVETSGRLQYPWYVAPYYGLLATGRATWQTLAGFGNILTTLARTGHVSQDVTGPIGIAVLTNQVSQLGFSALLQFTALISTSLAVLNFLPIPALDGGRGLFIVIEALRGRPVNRRAEAMVHAASFYILLILILLISVRDVQRFNLLNKIHF